MLTCVRSNEAREARRSEIDMKAWVWPVPAERMKMDRPHCPLPARAVAVLKRAERLNEDLVFPGTKPSKALPDATRLKLIRGRTGSPRTSIALGSCAAPSRKPTPGAKPQSLHADRSAGALGDAGKLSSLFLFRTSMLREANGGSGGIRTHGGVPPTLVFKTRALNHSATLPARVSGFAEGDGHRIPVTRRF